MPTFVVHAARRRLAELVAAAHRGETTLINRHGQPCAALVPLAVAGFVRGSRASLQALKGCAPDLWGQVPEGAVDQLRSEWVR